MNDYFDFAADKGHKGQVEISVGFADYNGALLMLKQLDRQLAACTRAVETARVSITRIAKQVELPCQLRPAIKAAARRNKKAAPCARPDRVSL